jgi:RNA polymerase sigma-70 factor (ECF subfamily)
MTPVHQTTDALFGSLRGDREAADRLMTLVYDDLRARAASLFRRERRNHTLQPTAVVHEAFFRMIDQTRVDWKGRTHFLAIAGLMMRRVLLDYGKRVHPVKVTLDEVAAGSKNAETYDFAALDAALTELRSMNPELAQVAELRYLAGMTVDECAGVLDVSPRKVKGDCRAALAWLRQYMTAHEA